MANIARWFADALRHQRAGDADAAYRVGRRVLEAEPGHGGALVLCGTYLLDRGRAEDALALLARAGEDAAAPPEARIALARALQATGRTEAAVNAARRVVADAPDSAAAHRLLGDLSREAGALEAALSAYREAARLDPSDATADIRVSAMLWDLGRFGPAREHLRAMAARHPGYQAAENDALFVDCYDPAVSPEALRASHETWGRAFVASLGARVARDHPNDPDPERPLRVGYLSPDLRRHPVAMFLAPIVAAHDPGAVVPHCYGSVRRPDEVTDAFRRVCPRWRDVRTLSDAAVAAGMRRDGIDILVDLAGWTADSRLRVLGLRPAPVQATYLGYPATTGLPTVDWRLTDTYANPPGTEAFFTEGLARIAGGFCAYLPPSDAPPVAPPPALENGHATFGSLMNTHKINPGVIALWARVLDAVPDARLLLVRAEFRSGEVRARVRDGFAAHGVDPARLDLEGVAAPRVHESLMTYSRIDVALDTFPYNGHTTTCEALWMGVPVIALAGRSFIDRVGVSLLSMAGLADLVAGTEDAYVGLAAALAKDFDRLARDRTAQRERLAASRLLDAAACTRALEDTYRGMWRAWCAGRRGT